MINDVKNTLDIFGITEKKNWAFWELDW
jgi:hypothetical protein